MDEMMMWQLIDGESFHGETTPTWWHTHAIFHTYYIEHQVT